VVANRVNRILAAAALFPTHLLRVAPHPYRLIGWLTPKRRAETLDHRVAA
jgi:hypothetical protein